MRLEFRKSLAKYYIKWFQDCHTSATYCEKQGRLTHAKVYLNRASMYLTIIMENLDAIDFFSIDDNAFKIDSALPEAFRGYK